jgi:hypothetical protein
MSDKVTLPREVAEAIELAKDTYGSITAIFEDARNGNLDVLHDYFKYNFDELIIALVNGYEIEKSPEDKVREYYDSVLNRLYTEGLDDQERRYVLESEACGILRTLDLLEIKIPGVNADA